MTSIKPLLNKHSSLHILSLSSFNSYLTGMGGEGKYKNLQGKPEKLSLLWQQRNCHGPLPIILAKKSSDNCHRLQVNHYYCIRQNTFNPRLPTCHSLNYYAPLLHSIFKHLLSTDFYFLPLHKILI